MTRQEYYKHLCNIGLPDVIAASMALQSSYAARQGVTDSMMSEVYAFTAWHETTEGFDFWSCIIDCLK